MSRVNGEQAKPGEAKQTAKVFHRSSVENLNAICEMFVWLCSRNGKNSTLSLILQFVKG